MKAERTLAGHCNCGQVRFELRTQSPDVYVCHCSLCRRATGSIGVTVVVVPKHQFSWTTGNEYVRRWRMPDHDWECSFCTECGSHLPGANDDDSVYVPAGLIDEGQEHLTVKHHIWVSSKAPWHDIGESGQRHERGFGDGGD